MIFFDPTSPPPYREKYWEYEYEEVITPNMYNFDLWRTSGHADHYKENMFHFDIEKAEFGLKPMNCPGTIYTISDQRNQSDIQCRCLSLF